jgi:hydrogenase maturation protein HypF
MAWRDAEGALVVEGEDGLNQAVAALVRGQIVAVKGVGGYHLMVRADDAGAVTRLRERKRRPMKPLAVMVADIAMAMRLGQVGEVERTLLESSSAPIVMLGRQEDGGSASVLAANVAPEVPCVGVMLASAPWHLLLLEGVGVPLVATSGNLSEEPLCIDDAEAVERLRGIADGFLGHNRSIARAADDSLVRVIGGNGSVLRRGRGYAPVEAPIRGAWREGIRSGILGAGGQMKNTLALTRKGRVLLSPHVGDLDNALTRESWQRSVRELIGLWGGETPERIAVDLHPDYGSSREAEKLNLPTVPVQHHLAHAVAAMAEAGCSKAVAVVWDGTGLGMDGTVWGGEFLEVTCGVGWRRIGRLRPFLLPGGERAVREPRRSALGLLWAMTSGAFDLSEVSGRLGFSDEEAKVLQKMLHTGAGCLSTTSAGRLFDGMAVLLGWCYPKGYEAQAAMALEFLAMQSAQRDLARDEGCPVQRVGDLWELDWAPAVAGWSDVPSDQVSAAARLFHVRLARGVADLIARTGTAAVVLAGGCFQNRLLSEAIMEECCRAGVSCFLPRDIPVNDGGLAAGQVLAADMPYLG